MYQCPRDGKWIICPHFDCMDCDRSTKINLGVSNVLVLRPDECVKIDYETALKEVDGAGSEK